MDKKHIVAKIEKFANIELAEKWDCSGVLVETSKSDIQKVLLCLTVTGNVVAQARELGCDMIISHHPLFFVPFEYKDIDIYCAHTNMDRAKGGTTDELMRILGVKADEISEELPFVRYGEITDTVDGFAKKLCEISDNVRVVNNKGVNEISKVAFCAGSGSEFINEAYDNGADAFVTGDLKFHAALDSKIVIFDIGHFESEIGVLKVFTGILGEDVEILYAEEKSPFVKY